MGPRCHARSTAPPLAAARREFWSRGAWFGALGVTPVLLTGFFVLLAVEGNYFAVDFGHGPWVAGRQLFDGLTPYVSPHSPQLVHGSPFVYPAVSAFLLAPLSVLSHGAAEGLVTALCMGAVLLTLRVLEIRDWRLYGVVLLWAPVVSGWQTANLTLLMGLGLGLAWRHRDNPLVAGGLFALLVSLKMFLWPLGLWLLATRRFAALGYAAALGLVMNLVAWAVVGFDQIGRYVHVMSALARIQERRGFSVLALVLEHGSSRALAYVLGLGLAAVVGLGCLVAGARRNDRGAFALGVATCLLATPIIWLHYFALLLVPLAIARPRLAPIWFLPVLLFFPTSQPHPWQVIVTLAVTAALTAVATLRPRSAPGRPHRVRSLSRATSAEPATS